MSVHITEKILNSFSRLALMAFFQLKVINQMWYNNWGNWFPFGMTSGHMLDIFSLSLQIYSPLYPVPQRLNSIIFISWGSPDQNGGWKERKVKEIISSLFVLNLSGTVFFYRPHLLLGGPSFLAITAVALARSW